MYVPCGKCLGCRMSKSREWSTRIIHESEYYPEGSIFLTLTYSEENLPEDKSLNKDEFINFMRRLKRRFDDRKLKYFACGEYGETYGRPHYHAIVMGVDFKELLPRFRGMNKKGNKVWSSDFLETIWKKGNNQIGSLSYKSARYVADYVGKQDDRPEMCAFRELPFMLMSQGIGKRWCLAHREQILENMDITIQGKSVGIPKYYQKILDIPRDHFREKAEERDREALHLYQKRVNRDKPGVWRVSELVIEKENEKEKALIQYDKNLKARKRVKGKL